MRDFIIPQCGACVWVDIVQDNALNVGKWKASMNLF
jgi:hypothetical protein